MAGRGPHGGRELRPDDFTNAQRSKFWAKVDVGAPDECWPWKACHSHVYGMVNVTRYHAPTNAHRVAYVLATGRVLPAGLLVRHTCDNPPCCNPAHLLEGRTVDNSRDMYERHRRDHIGPAPEVVRAAIASYEAGERQGSICTRLSIDPNTFRRRLTGEGIAIRGNCVLLDSQVIDIRERWDAGEKATAIARSLGLRTTTVHDAANGVTYRHLPRASRPAQTP